MTKTDQAIDKCIESIEQEEYLCIPLGSSSTSQSVSAVGQHVLVIGAGQETIANRRTDLTRVKTKFVGFVVYKLKNN